jgi:hypothetical protein
MWGGELFKKSFYLGEEYSFASVKVDQSKNF